jgi:Fe-S cluster assembly protein SufB
MENKLIKEVVDKQYPYGFETNIDSDTIAAGLNEDVIRLISARKNEPEFMLAWRLRAYAHWLTLSPPEWAHVHHDPIDYQNIIYYSAPKSVKDGPKSIEDVDPKLLETYEKLGIPLHERSRLAGVALDAVFYSI